MEAQDSRNPALQDPYVVFLGPLHMVLRVFGGLQAPDVEVWLAKGL